MSTEATPSQSPGRLSFLPGLLVCLLIAVPCWFLGKLVPTVGAAVFSILIGILLASCFPKILQWKLRGCALESGVKLTSKKLLQYSIILLGFEMNLYQVIRSGALSLYVMIFTLVAVFVAAYFGGKALHLAGNTKTLIGVGTAICGGSAIAATAPVIHADEDEISQAISTIFLFNILAVFLFPLLGRWMGMDQVSFGIWAGTAINDTSSVVAAGSAYGAEALQTATIVKLTRTLMIVPITLGLSVYTARKNRSETEGGFKLSKVFPFFVLLFIAACIVSTFVLFPLGLAPVAKFLGQAGKFMIVMAMAAIGLNTNLKKLLSNGVRPILLGSLCWFVVAVVALLVQQGMGGW